MPVRNAQCRRLDPVSQVSHCCCSSADQRVKGRHKVERNTAQNRTGCATRSFDNATHYLVAVVRVIVRLQAVTEWFIESGSHLPDHAIRPTDDWSRYTAYEFP